MAEKSLILWQQENLELENENSALKITVTKLLEELTRMKDVIRLPNNNVSKITKSTEEKIIEEQIDYLDAISAGRGLSLEETRALDLLIKNKKLLEEKSNKPIETDYNEVPETEDLLRIAGNVESEKPKRSKSKTGSKDPVA